MRRRPESLPARMLARLRALLSAEGGQILPIMAVMAFVLMGIGGLTIDVVHTLACKRELQASSDASALAAAQILPASALPGAPQADDPIAVATSYSSVTAGKNVSASLQSVSLVSNYPRLECLATLQAQGIACLAPVVGPDAGTAANAVQVAQKASVPLFFAGLFGFHSYTVYAISTAAIEGGGPRPSNIAVIMDSTLSMDAIDTDCSSNTQQQCALNGLQALMQKLNPCGDNNATCGPAVSGKVTNPFDSIALFTFPNVTSTTASIDTCTSTPPNPTTQNGYWPSTSQGFSNLFSIIMPVNTTGSAAVQPYAYLPTAAAYTFPTIGASSYTPVSATTVTGASATATYQITDFLSDYRVSDAATALNTSSSLVKAAGAASNCAGMQPMNYDGIYGTFYAGAIYAAQAALTHASIPGTDNVIILLSDGDATAGWNSNTSQPSNSYYGVYPALMTSSYAFTYPSFINECTQGLAAANYAKSQGTLFFTVAYGSPYTGCNSDNYGRPTTVSPCVTMYNMASASQMFYSDWKQSGSASTCYSGQPVTSLNDIFLSIAGTLTQPRLIPNNMT